MTTVVLAWVLIGLTPVNWWAFGIHLIAALRYSDVRALRMQLGIFGILSLASTFLAVLAANFLLGMPLPKGASFVLLTMIMVLISVPSAVFVLDHYRR